MTQTLRRELRLRFGEVLHRHIFAHKIDPSESEELLNELTDAALRVSGIANSPTAKKYSDPYWDLLHGGKPDENAVDLSKLYTSIAERLEKGLLRNEFPQTNDAQKVYRWIAEREKAGESLDEWIKWAMDGNRANYSYVYHQTPSHIKRDWPQAFAKSSVSKPGRRLERLNND